MSAWSDYYKKNRNRILARNRAWRKRNPEKKNAIWRRNEQAVRKEAITHYGHKCKRCGDKRYEVLTFDHINGGGHKHRKQVGSGSRFVRWLRRNGYPKIVQLLCWNCNAIKAYHKGKF